MNLVRECGDTKVTKKNGAEEKTGCQYISKSSEMKCLIAHYVVLAYLNFELLFELYANANDHQLSAISF